MSDIHKEPENNTLRFRNELHRRTNRSSKVVLRVYGQQFPVKVALREYGQHRPVVVQNMGSCVRARSEGRVSFCPPAPIGNNRFSYGRYKSLTKVE